MKIFLTAVFLVLMGCFPTQGYADMVRGDKVVLQGLDTLSRVFTVEAYINQQINFGTLRIYPRACYKSRPEDPPESTCFLEIFESNGDKPQYVFSGWMFASDPAISALEHPVYDLWIKEVEVLNPQEDEPAPQLSEEEKTIAHQKTLPKEDGSSSEKAQEALAEIEAENGHDPEFLPDPGEAYALKSQEPGLDSDELDEEPLAYNEYGEEGIY